MWKKIVLAVLIIISGVSGFLLAKARVTFNQSLDDNVTRDYDTALSNVDLSGIDVNSDNSVINILLIGNDYRKESGYGASGLTDVMMIATIDMKHKTLKLTSLMRDMYVEIPGYSSNKLNAAYSWGGIQLLYKTIATNFNIKLDGYVEVGFTAFEKVVNDVGGVDIVLSESESEYLNTTNYISNKKYRTTKVGKNHMNGNQALGYCRIRKHCYTPNGLADDYARTYRQRTTLSAVFDKAKTMPYSKWMKALKDVLKSVKTDLSNDNILIYAKDVMTMGTTELHQFRLPVEGYFSGQDVPGAGACLVMQTANQSEALNQFIFDYNGKGEFSYTPSGTVSSTTTP